MDSSLIIVIFTSLIGVFFAMIAGYFAMKKKNERD